MSVASSLQRGLRFGKPRTCSMIAGRVAQLHARIPRHPRRQPDAVGDQARDPVDGLAEQAHHERDRAEAVRDHVQPPVPDVPADDLDRRRIVVQRDVVERVAVREQVVRVPVAHPHVQAPHVRVAVVQQVADEVVVLGHDEHVRRRRQPVDDQDGVAGLVAGIAVEPQHAEAEPVLGGEVVGRDLGVADALERVERDLAGHDLVSSSSASAFGTGSVPAPLPAARRRSACRRLGSNFARFSGSFVVRVCMYL